MGREVDLTFLAPRADLLVAAALADLVLGDPRYRFHPVRLIGQALVFLEARLRAVGCDGYVGGCVLFVLLVAASGGAAGMVLVVLQGLHPVAALAGHGFLLYSLLALGDLFAHGRAIDAAANAGDLDGARRAAARLVGRDVERLDAAGCRRCAIESFGESLVDGFVSPIAWYAVAGLPGLVIFKLVSTMDSMVGYRTERYARFGWCGARLDDAMNLLPARAGWLLIAVAGAVVPGASGVAAARVGWSQHAVVPGPNAGWSETALAGAIRRRLAGPIHFQGRLVTDRWIGEPDDPPGGSSTDYRLAGRVVAVAALLTVVAAATWLA
ncbi:MAG: cobalamin biosynthesis protein [Acidobacteria bacterium]|nr:cobalamin biosynthesis protein [Acidobacteriota bacterium]MYJ03040.1 cobalamin biosynthesis protein [Acidobacteriota bacterium]